MLKTENKTKHITCCFNFQVCMFLVVRLFRARSGSLYQRFYREFYGNCFSILVYFYTYLLLPEELNFFYII